MRLNKYINEGTKYDRGIIKYLSKTYPDVEGLRIALFDGKNWYYYEYDYGLKLLMNTTDFEELGIDSEWTWKSERDNKLAKILKVKKAYVMDL